MITILQEDEDDFYLIEIFTIAFLYAVMLMALFEPWLYNFVGDNFTIDKMMWSIFIIVLSILLAKKIEIIAKVKRLLILVVFTGINFLVINFLSWEFQFYSVLFLLFLYLGIRFTFYGKVINYVERSFNKDFTLLTVIMLISVYYSTRGKLDVNYLNVIIFFGIGISLSIYFNFKKVTIRKKRKLMSMIAGVFVLAAILFKLLVSYGQTASSKLGSFLGRTYHYLVDLFMIIMKYVLIILTPFVKIYQKLILWLFGGGEPVPEKPGRPMQDYRNMIENMREGPIKEFNPPYWILYLLLGIFIILLAVKMIRMATNNEETGVREERESVLSMEEIKKDLGALFSSIKEPFSSKRNIYDGSSDIMKIREIYYKFLINFKNIRVKRKYDTPNIYYQELSQERKVIEKGKVEEIETVTKTYNRARYRNKLAPDDLKKAKNAWKNISEN